MNRLTVGRYKSALLRGLNHPFLFIDDGEEIEKLSIPERRAVTLLDLDRHTFNPLSDMTPAKADAFLDVLDGTYPEGRDTLTSRYSSHLIFNALLDKPRSLAGLVEPPRDNKDVYRKDAYQKIERLLSYPVLERVLKNGPHTLPITVRREGKRDELQTILARLNRAELGDRVCFVLGNLLINQYPGQVVVTDYGFYAIPAHRALIQQRRLAAAINSFEEIPELKSDLLLIDDREGYGCTYDDAVVLAKNAGLRPDPLKQDNEYNEYIDRCLTVPESEA